MALMMNSADRELVEMVREARHRVAEKAAREAGTTYRRGPVEAAYRVSDLEHRLAEVRAMRGDPAAVRALATEELAFDELIREAKAANAVTEAEIYSEPDEVDFDDKEEELQWQ